MDPDQPVEAVEQEGLTAVTSRVRLDEFSEAALAENVRDVAWVARKALVHEALLERLCATGFAVVPFRFGTIYRDRSHVEDFLRDRAAALESALDLVDGRVELGVVGVLDRVRAIELAGAKSEPEGAGSGTAYLARRKAELERKAEIEAGALAHIREIHAALARAAVDARTNPPRRPEDRDEVPIFNAAYLVERSGEAGFRDLVTSLAGDAREEGLRVEVTGPWPPYNFVSEELGGR